MKTLIVLLILGVAGPACSMSKIQAKSCEQLLCLSGEKKGKNPLECNEPLSAYKKIMKKSKWGKKILCQQTKEMRLAQLMICEQTDYSPTEMWNQLVDCDD